MSADSIWKDAVAEAICGNEVTSRAGNTYESLAFQSSGNPLKPFLFDKTRTASPIYASAELLWYMNGSDSGDMICHYAPSYNRFLNEGKAMGAYGARIFATLAYEDIAKELFRGQSRRAVVPIFGLSDLRNTRDESCKDIPCSLSLQFMNRDGELHMITTMRSNDVWLGLPYDSFCFMMIQLMMCELTGLSPGVYFHQAGSLHLYERNLDLIDSGMPGGDDPQMYPSQEGEELELVLNYERPTLSILPGIRSTEITTRSGSFTGEESRFANTWGDFSIPTTLLTLASCRNYSKMSNEDIVRLSRFVDPRLIKRASEIVNSRASK